MQYPAIFTHDTADGGYVVTFPDIPEAITQGDTFEEALLMAHDVLVSSMDFYFEDRRTVPLPSAPVGDKVLIGVPASLWAKVLSCT